MKISDIMTKITPLLVSDSIGKAASVFLADDLDIVPVVDEQSAFAGTLTHENILSACQVGIDS
ncbi:MAG: hypothetical protein PHN75_01650, partial [Syntrophales bacterium]|nr:hypothetical protein [Syntrophales bacterium]